MRDNIRELTDGELDIVSGGGAIGVGCVHVTSKPPTILGINPNGSLQVEDQDSAPFIPGWACEPGGVVGYDVPPDFYG